MAVLPAGFALPPLPYLLALVVALAAVVGALWRLGPAVTDRTVLGLAPWMGVGSACHALFVLGLAPAAVAPLFGVPAVYVTVFVVLGALWAGLTAWRPGAPDAVAWYLGGVGVGLFVLAAVTVLALGGGLTPFWPLVAIVVALVLAAATWVVLGRLDPAARATGSVGALVVFAHGLDGVTTAVGVDVLGFGERTPFSRAILGVAGRLPVAETVGVGWLFVLVKLALAALVVSVFTGYLDENPRQARLLLALVAAVGLGPGLYNLLLYAVAG